MSTEEEKKEIQELLNLKIEELGKLEILEDEYADDFSVDEDPETSPRQREEFQKFLEDIPKGQEGFNTLIQSPRIKSVDDRISHFVEKEPEEEPFQDSFLQMQPSDRSFKYKRYILVEYQRTLKRIENIYQKLASGASISYGQLGEAVDPFMNVLESDRAIVQNLSSFIYTEDDYLFNHLIRVCLLAINIAAASGLSKQEVREVGIAALLADTGMTMIDKNIRKKPGPLNSDEMYEVHKHPILGLHCLERINNIPDPIIFVAYQHHERLSGAGYPKRRRGRIIHKYSRIVAIADVFEAMCSERTYRIALNPNEALKKVTKMAVMNLLDIHYVQNFIKSVSYFPVGSLVKLNDGHIAKVIQANENEPKKPLIINIADANGRILPKNEMLAIDLSHDKGIKIQYPLDRRPEPENVMFGF